MDVENRTDGADLSSDTSGEPMDETAPGPGACETGTKERSSRRIKGVHIIAAAAVLAALALSFFLAVEKQAVLNESKARLAAGQEALFSGDLDRALYEYTEALRLNPSSPTANRALGQIALAYGRGDEAAKRFEAELQINPNDRQSRLALACLYVLGIVPPDDPHSLRMYLLQRFSEIAPADYDESLVFVPPEGCDPLATAIYHFHYVAERAPGDPLPAIGMALAHLANYDLAAARDRLNRTFAELSTNQSVDQQYLSMIRDIIDDINQEEMYLARQERIVWSPPPDVLQPFSGVSPEESVQQVSAGAGELTGVPGTPSIEPLPAMPGNAFGSRFAPGTEPADEAGLGLRLTAEKIFPQPTVKPISRDIHIESTGEWVHQVRLVNINQSGEVGFREGETVVMPVTNNEVKVIEFSDDRIVLEEQGAQFVWVPGEVGWVLQDTVSLQSEPSLEISATRPEERGNQGVREDETSGSEEQGVMGPEVPADR